MDDPTGATAPRRRRRRIPGPVRHALGVLLLLLAIEYVLLPQLAGTGQALHLLLDVDNGWLLAALGLEVGSLLAYGLLTRSVLPTRQGRPPLGTVLRIDLSTLALSHIVPGGSAAGLGLGYRLLTRAGMRGSDAAFAKGVQAIGSAIVLNAILWVTLVASIILHGFSSIYGPVALVGVVLLTAAGTLAVLLTRGERHVAGWLAGVLGRLPRIRPEQVADTVAQLAAELRVLRGDRRLLREATGWAAANWLLDAAALWACVRAFGHTLGPDGVLVPYGIAMVLAALPFTPGGIGIVEGFLIPALVGFHTPRAAAILGVLAWRLINFVLPIPLGGLAYLSLGRLRRPTGDDPGQPTPEEDSVAEL